MLFCKWATRGRHGLNNASSGKIIRFYFAVCVREWLHFTRAFYFDLTVFVVLLLFMIFFFWVAIIFQCKCLWVIVTVWAIHDWCALRIKYSSNHTWNISIMSIGCSKIQECSQMKKTLPVFCFHSLGCKQHSNSFPSYETKLEPN